MHAVQHNSPGHGHRGLRHYNRVDTSLAFPPRKPLMVLVEIRTQVQSHALD